VAHLFFDLFNVFTHVQNRDILLFQAATTTLSRSTLIPACMVPKQGSVRRAAARVVDVEGYLGGGRSEQDDAVAKICGRSE
jgi:hypothetical protein